VKNGKTIRRAPWNRVRKDVTAAFVFDLVTVPAP